MATRLDSSRGRTINKSPLRTTCSRVTMSGDGHNPENSRRRSRWTLTSTLSASGAFWRRIWRIYAKVQQHRETVCSVGIIPRRLPFTSSNGAIKTFRHALSLDEHRAKFKANHYQWPTADEARRGVQPGEMPKASQSAPAMKSRISVGRKRSSTGQEEELHEQEFSSQDPHNNKTDVLEVWFAGCHCGEYFSHVRTGLRLTAV